VYERKKEEEGLWIMNNENAKTEKKVLL